MQKYEIDLSFELGKDLKNELFGIAVENFLFSNCQILEQLQITASAQEFFKYQGNVLGANGYSLQIRGGGVIKYLNLNNLLNKYIAHIEINGIDENSEKTKEIISQLEKISKAKSIDEIKEFLPKN
jgi:hypothetical protein